MIMVVLDGVKLIFFVVFFLVFSCCLLYVKYSCLFIKDYYLVYVI